MPYGITATHIIRRNVDEYERIISQKVSVCIYAIFLEVYISKSFENLFILFVWAKCFVKIYTLLLRAIYLSSENLVSPVPLCVPHIKELLLACRRGEE